MRKISPGGQSPPIHPSPPTELRPLSSRLEELQALHLEATAILDDLTTSRSAEIIRGLCAGFRILQEDFVTRYHEARTLANSALGSVEAVLAFPEFHPASPLHKKPIQRGA